MISRVAVVALAAGAVLVTTAPGGAHDPPAKRRADPRDPLSANPSFAVIGPAADFTLTDSADGPVRLESLRGKVVLISFIYTKCPGACPLVTQRMAVLQKKLRAAGLSPERVTLVSITVDPDRDTREAFTRYRQAFGARDGWFFLTDSAERLRSVWTAYDEWTKQYPNGEIDHPARLHLIDARGRVREIYSLALFDERQAFLDVQSLVREGIADR